MSLGFDSLCFLLFALSFLFVAFVCCFDLEQCFLRCFAHLLCFFGCFFSSFCPWCFDLRFGDRNWHFASLACCLSFAIVNFHCFLSYCQHPLLPLLLACFLFYFANHFSQWVAQ